MPYLCTILMLILLNACVAPKRVKVLPPEWSKDAAPDGCETAQDWGAEPYDIEKPCKMRSTDKI